jgi:hypothetical protein
MFLAQCFLEWDCFSDGSEHVVVQKIPLRILSRSAHRAMTGQKSESAVSLIGVFMQLLECCGALQYFDHQPAYYIAAH